MLVNDSHERPKAGGGSTDGLYLAQSSDLSRIQTIIDTATPGNLVDTNYAPADAVIATAGLERDGLRNDQLVITASAGLLTSALRRLSIPALRQGTAMHHRELMLWFRLSHHLSLVLVIYCTDYQGPAHYTAARVAHTHRLEVILTCTGIRLVDIDL